ncbi:VRR-NUC domain-containing protein [uncultured Thiodictyon sp.]|uniref:VRR-NUC domain-containing protein n=1 Tax=uncultured Thiodictyon sp. TaxID=1846217 RepID=UPI0025E08330|nr:VRR-NUC domain-containing protein [uncultured Thiodictyon sp.]
MSTGPERAIEQHLAALVRAAGGIAYKWSSPGRPGVPDRLVILPGAPARVIGVEVKAPGKRPTVLQARVLAALAALGVEVAVVDSRAAAQALVASVAPEAASTSSCARKK